jgi:hypothetical protein
MSKSNITISDIIDNDCVTSAVSEITGNEINHQNNQQSKIDRKR